MANQILIKKTNVQGKVPATTDLALGELGLNTYDGKLFFKKNVLGIESVLTLDPNPTSIYSWNTIIDKPTTIGGYGITDGYSTSTGVPWSDITGIPTIQSDLTECIPVPATSGTSIIPFDNTTPLITEGTLIATGNYVASKANSKMKVSGSILVSVTSNNRNIILSLFRNTTCVGVATLFIASANRNQLFSFLLSDLNMGSTFGSTVSYTVRIGVNSATTWYVNRQASAIFNGLLVNNSIVFSEFI